MLLRMRVCFWLCHQEQRFESAEHEEIAKKSMEKMFETRSEIVHIGVDMSQKWELPQTHPKNRLSRMFIIEMRIFAELSPIFRQSHRADQGITH